MSKVDLFYDSFVGEFVEIFLKVMETTTVSNEEETAQMSAPMSIQGFLLDIDKYYFYLGKNPLEVSAAIKKNMVGMIQIAEQKTVFDEVLDQMDLPKNPEEVN